MASNATLLLCLICQTFWLRFQKILQFQVEEMKRKDAIRMHFQRPVNEAE
jgi:hypothetical protein